jgi:septal ring factor EnvC (AmiA/AmiB activator)
MGDRDHEKPSPATAPAMRLLALGALAALTALSVTAASSGAQSVDELNSKIAAARGQAQTLGAQIDAASAELRSAQQRAIAAAQREAQLSAVLARGEQREARLEVAVGVARDRLRAARAQLARSLDSLADRLVDIYRGSMPDSTTLLLESDGFDDLVTRSEYLTRVEEADAALVGRVRSLRDSVRIKLAEVEEAERRAQAFNERIAAARDQIAAVRADAEAQAAALADARAQRQAALSSLQSQVGGWESEVQRLERISAQQAEQEVSDWVGDWAIPESIVQCESGGNFNAVNPSSGAGGAYQILPSTWDLYGGEGDPEDAAPGEQSQIASQIWSDSGAAAWECAQ